MLHGHRLCPQPSGSNHTQRGGLQHTDPPGGCQPRVNGSPPCSCSDLSGQEVPKQGDRCIHTAESLGFRAETNTAL